MEWYNKDEMKKLITRKNSVLVVWDVQEALVNSIFNKDEFLTKLKELIDKKLFRVTAGNVSSKTIREIYLRTAEERE